MLMIIILVSINILVILIWQLVDPYTTEIRQLSTSVSYLFFCATDSWMIVFSSVSHVKALDHLVGYWWRRYHYCLHHGCLQLSLWTILHSCPVLPPGSPYGLWGISCMGDSEGQSDSKLVISLCWSSIHCTYCNWLTGKTGSTQWLQAYWDGHLQCTCAERGGRCY